MNNYYVDHKEHVEIWNREKWVSRLTLAIKDRECDWDIYANHNGYLFAICKDGNRERDSHFGDKYHIKRLMNFKLDCIKRGHPHNPFEFCNLTERGLEILSGLFSDIEDRYIKFSHRS